MAGLWLDAGWKDPAKAFEWYNAGWLHPKIALRWRNAGWKKPEEALLWCNKNKWWNAKKSLSLYKEDKKKKEEYERKRLETPYSQLPKKQLDGTSD